MNKVRTGLFISAFLAASTVNASAFQMSFKWCGSGSPAFSLSGVPKGTVKLSFHMIDLDKPSYNHGGGDVVYRGKPSVACGALSNYEGPSPPAGPHTYRIDVVAKDVNGMALATATASRKFPER